MKELDSYKIIDIERPFYFLCGPSMAKTKKRNVLATFLRKQYVKKTIRPFPIIVDEIFDSPLIEKYNLDLVLLEEIVAATSLKTYIFLDSLSTAYELGLFKNSKSENSVRILLEQSFNKRKRRDVGLYIQKSIGKSSFLKYQAEHSGDKLLEHYEFKDGKVSKSIINCVEKEINDYKKNIQSIEIVSGNKGNDPNKVYANISGRCFEAILSLKSLFYTMEVFLYNKYTSYRKIIAIDNKEFKTLYKEFCLFIKSLALNKLGSKLDKVTIYDETRITINQFDKEKVYDIIRHTYFFFVLLNESKGTLHRLSKRGAFHDASMSYDGGFDFYSLFETANNKIIKIIQSYLSNPDLYVDCISYVINKKKRKIYKYKDNYKGKQLRFIHEQITKMLNLILPSSPLSFAYKNNQNTLKCISKHRESCNFLKLDIHHYFESIKYQKFLLVFMKQLSKNLKNNGIEEKDYHNKSEFKKYIKALFYKGHIPLGFVSSPKVSDFYLKSVDDWAEKNINIRYSRYADDILMSTSDIDYTFDEVKDSFEKRIGYKGLTINQKKVISKKLLNDGDCIKFLGICLVKKDDKNEIRISKHYLKETIKECYEAEERGTLKDEHIIGKIRYIKCISEQSYQRVLKALSNNDKGKKIVSIFKSILV